MIIAGDWSPGEKNVRVQLEAEAFLANLEGPILPAGHGLAAAPKAGPSLFSLVLPAISGNTTLATANNHVMDYGERGLELTLSAIEQKGFRAVGTGRDMLAARTPVIVQDRDKVVGVISCCEAQFGVAGRKQPGAAEIGPWVYDAIHKLTQETDLVIVSVHAAAEDSPWPSPYIQELYRSYVDAGASVVHGHHAHIPQGMEEYHGGFVFYGLGNFAVDPDAWKQVPNALWSLGIEIGYGARGLAIRPLTFEMRSMSGNEIRVERSTKEEEARRLDYLERCSRPLADPYLLEALWQEVSLHNYQRRYAHWLGFASQDQGELAGQKNWKRIRDTLRRLKGALASKQRMPAGPSRSDYLLWYVLFACESHRSAIATALGILGGEIKDLRTDESHRLVSELWP